MLFFFLEVLGGGGEEGKNLSKSKGKNYRKGVRFFLEVVGKREEWGKGEILSKMVEL